MSKQISAKELGEIVSKLLDPNDPNLPGYEDAQRFMTDLANLVCEHCGGEVQRQADLVDGEWLVGVHGNSSLPEDGGVWAGYDPEGQLFAEPALSKPTQ